MPYITSIERMGIAEGLEQGLAQGRQEGQRSLILRLLTRQVGEVPEGVRDRIKQLPIEKLEAIGEALFDFTQLADLAQWLESNQ